MHLDSVTGKIKLNKTEISLLERTQKLSGILARAAGKGTTLGNEAEKASASLALAIAELPAGEEEEADEEEAKE